MQWYWFGKGWNSVLLCGFPQAQCVDQEGLVLTAADTGGTGEYGGCHAFFNDGFQEWILVPESQQYTGFTVENLGFYKFTCMPFGLCNIHGHM